MTIDSLEVVLGGDWGQYAQPMAGFEMLGLVHRGGRDYGALAHNPITGTYVQINGAAIVVLERDEVVVAIALARRRARGPHT